MTVTSHRLEAAALEIRRRFLKMHHEAKSGHVGSGLSAIDLLTYLYSDYLRPTDGFILSKGHAASSLYAVLRHFGHFTEELFASYYQDGTLLPAHPAANAHPAILAATGSLGHGLPIATGIAYAQRHLLASDQRIVCLLSDGECNEGAVWEAAMVASHHHLSNLTAIVDANGFQGFGRTAEVLNLEPLAQKWEAFGFQTAEINGHDFEQIAGALAAPVFGKPRCIIARTVKGKGVSFLEDTLQSHYLPLNDLQYQQALAELQAVQEGWG